jgi:hypothetical protein
MTATYTFDVFSSLDGYGSYREPGDWGGYWGKQGPELLDHRLALGGEGPIGGGSPPRVNHAFLWQNGKASSSRLARRHRRRLYVHMRRPLPQRPHRALDAAALTGCVRATGHR